MKKIYILTHPFHFTSHFEKEYLKDKAIVFTRNPLAADILVSTTSKILKYKLARILFPFKKFMIYTSEPRFDLESKNFKYSNRIIMNVYSKNVFLHNLHFLGCYHSNYECNLGIDLQCPPGEPLTLQKLEEKKKFCLAVFGYRDPKKSPLMIAGKDADLYVRRQNLALFFRNITRQT